MSGRRSYHASFTPIFALPLLATCAGCWEEIQYTGTPSPDAPASTTAVAVATPTTDAGTSAVQQNAGETNALPADATTISTPLPADETAPSVPPPNVPISPAKPEDDRYATASPAKSPAANEAAQAAILAESAASAVDPPQSRLPTATAPTEPAAATTSDDRYAVPPQATTDNPRPSESLPVMLPAATSPATATTQGADPRNNDAPRPPDKPTATSPPPSPATASTAMSTRHAAWILGSGVSLAALAHDRGVAKDRVPIWFDQARAAAKLLGASLADLPAPAAASDKDLASRQVLDYLLVDGQRIGRELTKQHGPEEAALFEIAVKTNILLLLYAPGSTEGGSVANAISQAAPRAKLPAELWRPLVDTLDGQLPPSEVRLAVRKLHIDVNEYLAGSTEQGRR